MSDSHLFSVVSKMPKLRHGALPGMRFDIANSDVVKWLLDQPAVQQYVFNRMVQLRLVVYQGDGTWRGAIPARRSKGRPVTFHPERLLPHIPFEQPGLRLADIHRRCLTDGAPSKSLVHYHLKRLVNDGLIQRRDYGRRNPMFWRAPEIVAAPESSKHQPEEVAFE